MATMKRIILPALGLLLLPVAAHAQAAGGQAVDDILQQFQAATNGWDGRLHGLALRTFEILAFIEFAWQFGKLALQNPEFGDFLTLFVRELLFVGLMLFLLTTTTTWAPAIIHSFEQAAGAAGGGPTSPGDVLDMGVNLAGRIMDAMSMWHPEAAVGLMIAGLIMGCAFALIIAEWVFVLIESYVVMNCAVLFMAFGSNAFTSDIAIGVLRVVFTTGAKLFGVQIVAALGTTIISTWVAKFNGNITSRSLVLEIVVALIFAVISLKLPATIERMAGGHGHGAHAGEFFRSANTARNVGQAIVTGSVGGAINAGSRMAGGMSQAQSSMAARVASGTAPKTQAGRFASVAMGAVGNVAGAGIRDAASRMAGRDIGRRFSGGQRQA